MEESEGESPTYRSDESVEKEHRVGLCRLGGGERRVVARVGRVRIFVPTLIRYNKSKRVHSRSVHVPNSLDVIAGYFRTNSLKVRARWCDFEPSHRRSKH